MNVAHPNVRHSDLIAVHEELPADEAHRGGNESCVTALQTSGDDLHLLVNVGILAKLVKDILVGGAGHGKVEPVVLGTKPGLQLLSSPAVL